jgi:hypothetical protein
MKPKPQQNPYPWYAVNKVTRELEPYAIYAARRENLNRIWQPESDAQFLKFGPDGRVKEINTDLLAESVCHDTTRYTALSGDPLMIDIGHSLIHAPEKITALAKLNTSYMSGFRLPPKKWSEIQQARVHMMTACLLLGECDDHLITKKWLWLKTLELWTYAWIRAKSQKDGTRIYHPSEKLLAATMNELPPVRAAKAKPPRKWKRERVCSSLGLHGIWGARESGRGENSLGMAGVPQAIFPVSFKLFITSLLRVLVCSQPVEETPTGFEWEMVLETPPENFDRMEALLHAAYAALDGE